MYGTTAENLLLQNQAQGASAQADMYGTKAHCLSMQGLLGLPLLTIHPGTNLCSFSPQLWRLFQEPAQPLFPVLLWSVWLRCFLRPSLLL